MRQPVTELDARFSDSAAVATDWEKTRRVLEDAELFWIATVRADGRPHLTPLVAVWLDDAVYFATGFGEQKAVNLRTNQNVILTTGCSEWERGLDVVVEGEAVRVTEESVLERLAEAWATKWAYDGSVTTARYDGQAEWYESFAAAELFVEARAAAVRLLGHGSGRCLDLGCGTGRAIPLLAAAGWRVTGVDVSRDQLRVAEQHAADAEELVCADAQQLPFADDSFDAVVSILTHTDFDDPLAAFSEARRVLRPGCPFVYLGVHPCFGSPAVERRDGEPALLHPEYRRAGWQTESRNFSETGIRSRVGINHAPLAAFLNALLASGFVPVEFEEPGELDPPLFLAVRATG